MPERVDQRHHVADAIQRRKRRQIIVELHVRTAAAPVAALIGRDDVVPGLGERQHYVAPAEGQFGKAVQQQDGGATRGFKARLEDMDVEDQREVLRALDPDDRAAIEEALSYPEESAGRLMQRELIAVPDHWTVGDVIDFLRHHEELTTDFWEIFVVDAGHHPVGTCQLSWILRTPRSIAIGDVMKREQTLIPVDMDQEEVALRFQKYALISAAVVDASDRLVGMITVDDIVHIIQQEAGEDALRLSGAGEGDINEPIRFTVRTRIAWLVVNLGATMLSASVASAQNVEVRGSRRVDADTIRNYFAGTDPARVNQAVKELYATGLFSSVRTERAGGRIIVTVVENQMINRVFFEGNSKIKSDVLASEVQSRSRGAYNPSTVQADIARILDVAFMICGVAIMVQFVRNAHRIEPFTASE